jgi:hypothetical protein
VKGVSPLLQPTRQVSLVESFDALFFPFSSQEYFEAPVR